MASGIKDRDIEEILKTLDRLAINPDELEQWTMSVETTAKDIRKDNDSLIVFEYDADKKQMHFFLVFQPAVFHHLARSNIFRHRQRNDALQPFLLKPKINTRARRLCRE